MGKNRSVIFMGGMLFGAAIGTLSGLLVAPQTSRQTRRILKKSAQALPEIAEDVSSSVQIQADRLSASALKNWDETLDRLRDAIAAGMEATQQEREILTTKPEVEVSSEAGDRQP
ncbi:YtxH domain-containing protein [Phormidium pseudopriestleyi FRX01]|uniref:YtxH domain-containing protein n=1 Tax=Phormidium pseudopriestleyi FRX01 TaxID=1759528 RepID=A0ABS3FN01_9CYAN|nr:YtxH domain-containing protein [Phormidium pseudopriestleyi]MBO0348466.1 YtxH domain-containing protein [Phormidium pseudopriestleyi FRX01]